MINAIDPAQVRNLIGQEQYDLLGNDAISKYSEKQAAQDTATAKRREKDFVVVVPEGMKIDFKNTAPAATEPNTGPTNIKYGQVIRGNAVPIEKAGRAHFVDREGNVVQGSLKGPQFNEWMNNAAKTDPTGFKKFLKANPSIGQNRHGDWVVKKSADAEMVKQLLPGMQQNTVSSGILGTLQNNSWLLPTMGFMTGGVGGLVMGLIGAKALKSSAGGMSAGGGSSLAPALLGMGGSSASNYLGGYGSSKLWGTVATALGVTTSGDGMAFQMKKQMASYAQEAKMDSLIAMCNNPGIPIEDLIAMFMAQMADTYDQKLREKMEETARAEKREQARNREKEAGDYKAGLVSSLGSVAGMIPGWGTAIAAGSQVVASGMKMKTDAKIAMTDALEGNSKSSTILMQEIQILMNKWKQVNELLSNLSKSLHDMAMTPIRNLR